MCVCSHSAQKVIEVTQRRSGSTNAVYVTFEEQVAILVEDQDSEILFLLQCIEMIHKEVVLNFEKSFSIDKRFCLLIDFFFFFF